MFLVDLINTDWLGLVLEAREREREDGREGEVIKCMKRLKH